MTGRWVMAAIQTTFAVMPALVYWFAGLTIAQGNATITIGTLVAFTTLQTRLFFPIGSLLGVQVEVQSSLALFDRIFEYLDQPVDIVEGTRTLESPRGEVELDSVWFRYDDAAWTLQDVSLVVPPGTKTALVGETGSGRRPARTSWPGSMTRAKEPSRSTAWTSATSRSSPSLRRSASCPRRRICFTRPFGRTCASRDPRQRTRRSRMPHEQRRSTS